MTFSYRTIKDDDYEEILDVNTLESRLSHRLQSGAVVNKFKDRKLSFQLKFINFNNFLFIRSIATTSATKKGEQKSKERIAR